MRRIRAKIMSPGLQLFVKHYFKKSRPYSYKGLKFKVFPTVFFPHFTMSTKMLIDFLEQKNLNGKSLLELGCGTGMISVFSAKNGARVMATDINPTAIENVKFNAERNETKVEAIESNLFDKITDQKFDYIIINPPYYPKAPSNIAENAWYCGEEFEYFKKLFPSLNTYFDENSTVLMILSEDCELSKIQEIAAENALLFSIETKKKKWGEWTYIYSISRHS